MMFYHGNLLGRSYTIQGNEFMLFQFFSWNFICENQYCAMKKRILNCKNSLEIPKRPEINEGKIMQRPKKKTTNIYKALHEKQTRTPLNKRQIIPKGESKMDNLAKLATYKTKCRVHKTQDADKQNKNTTQYELDTTMHKQTQTT